MATGRPSSDPFEISQRVVHNMVLKELSKEQDETAANFLRRRYLEDLEARSQDDVRPEELEFFGEGEDKQILGSTDEDEVS